MYGLCAFSGLFEHLCWSHLYAIDPGIGYLIEAYFFSMLVETKFESLT
jgi:hypothetical protein